MNGIRNIPCHATFYYFGLWNPGYIVTLLDILMLGWDPCWLGSQIQFCPPTAGGRNCKINSTLLIFSVPSASDLWSPPPTVMT